jgi:hypothetical protein
MFSFCSKLSYIKVLAEETDTGSLDFVSGSNYLDSWLYNTSNRGTIVKSICMLDRNHWLAPSNWDVKISCVTPSIVNLTNYTINFNHSGGVYGSNGSQNEVLPYVGFIISTFKPEYNINVDIVYNSEKSGDNGVSKKTDLLWENSYTLSELLNANGINNNIENIAIVIVSSPDIPDDDYYYSRSISLDEESLIDEASLDEQN